MHIFNWSFFRKKRQVTFSAYRQTYYLRQAKRDNNQGLPDFDKQYWNCFKSQCCAIIDKYYKICLQNCPEIVHEIVHEIVYEIVHENVPFL